VKGKARGLSEMRRNGEGLLDGSGSGYQDPNWPYELNLVRVTEDEDVGTFAASIYGPDLGLLSCG
jgi:hypothetical protein